MCAQTTSEAKYINTVGQEMRQERTRDSTGYCVMDLITKWMVESLLIWKKQKEEQA